MEYDQKRRLIDPLKGRREMDAISPLGPLEYYGVIIITSPCRRITADEGEEDP